MDYENRRRVKIWGRAEVVDDDAALLQRVRSSDSDASIERVIVIHVDAWDVNCPKHIPRKINAA